MNKNLKGTIMVLMGQVLLGGFLASQGNILWHMG